MPYILALDTTGSAGSIALASGPTLLEELSISAPDGYGQILFATLDALLARHRLEYPQIECFASASGPGSFTGVRVGLTAAKGLADAANARIVAVSNLQAMAWFGTAQFRAPWIDARRGEIYGAVYDADLRLVQEETVTRYEPWAAGLPEGAEQILQGPPLARAIAAIAWQRLQAGETQDPAQVDANYVRRSDAEMMWRDL